MGRMVKAVLIALIACCLFPKPVYAIDHAFFSNEEWAGVNALMDRMSASSEFFGVEDVDFESLYVTDAIPTYNYYEGELLRGNDVWLAYDGQDLVFAFWGPFSGAYTTVPYADSFERALATLGSSNVALIRDCNGINITDGEEVLLTQESHASESRLLDELPPDPELVAGWEDMVLTDASNRSALGYATPALPQTLVDVMGYRVSAVPLPRQSYSNTCWAACCVSLLVYRGYWPASLNSWEFNDAWLANAVLTYYGGDNPNVLRSDTDMRDILNFCLQRTGPGDHAYAVYNSCPSYSYIAGYIQADSPAIALMKQWDTQLNVPVNGPGHAAILNGYQINGNQVCIWWPNEGDDPTPVELVYNTNNSFYYFMSPYGFYTAYYVSGVVYET